MVPAFRGSDRTAIYHETGGLAVALEGLETRDGL